MKATKKRYQVTVGPASQTLVNSLARRFRKEANVELSFVDVLESATHLGLNQMAKRHEIPVEPLASLRK